MRNMLHAIGGSFCGAGVFYGLTGADPTPSKIIIGGLLALVISIFVPGENK